MGIFGRLFKTYDPQRLATDLVNEARIGNYAAVKSIVDDVMANAPSKEDRLRELFDKQQSQEDILAAVAAGGLRDKGTDDLLALGLFEAATQGHLEIVELLVNHGANMDRPHASSGSTAMGIAAFAGQNEVVQFLTRRAANVNAKNCEGVTPFMLAVAKCSAETISEMIEARADLHSESDDGLTVKDFASMPPRPDILALLESAPESGVNAKGKEIGLTAPAARGGVCQATYEKHGLVMKAFAGTQSFGPIKYLYILEVSSKSTGAPLFYITAEYNELVGNQEPVLGIFDETGHHNLGQRPEISQLHVFIATARLVALEHIAGTLGSQ